MELRKVKKARIEEAGWRVRVYVRQAWQGQEEAGCETPGPRSTTSPSVNDFLAPTSLILTCYWLNFAKVNKWTSVNNSASRQHLSRFMFSHPHTISFLISLVTLDWIGHTSDTCSLPELKGHWANTRGTVPGTRMGQMGWWHCRHAHRTFFYLYT